MGDTQKSRKQKHVLLFRKSSIWGVLHTNRDMSLNQTCFLLVRSTNKSYFSQLIQWLILEIAKCVFDGIQIGGHCWLMPTIRWKDPFNRRTDRRRLAGCWHTSLLTSQTSVCSAEKKSQIACEISNVNFYELSKMVQIGLDLSKLYHFLIWQDVDTLVC